MKQPLRQSRDNMKIRKMKENLNKIVRFEAADKEKKKKRLSTLINTLAEKSRNGSLVKWSRCDRSSQLDEENAEKPVYYRNLPSCSSWETPWRCRENLPSTSGNILADPAADKSTTCSSSLTTDCDERDSDNDRIDLRKRRLEMFLKMAEPETVAKFDQSNGLLADAQAIEASDKIAESVPDPKPDKRLKTTETFEASASLNAPQYPQKPTAKSFYDQNEEIIQGISKKRSPQQKLKKKKMQDPDSLGNDFAISNLGRSKLESLLNDLQTMKQRLRQSRDKIIKRQKKGNINKIVRSEAEDKEKKKKRLSTLINTLAEKSRNGTLVKWSRSDRSSQLDAENAKKPVFYQNRPSGSFWEKPWRCRERLPSTSGNILADESTTCSSSITLGSDDTDDGRIDLPIRKKRRIKRNIFIKKNKPSYETFQRKKSLKDDVEERKRRLEMFLKLAEPETIAEFDQSNGLLADAHAIEASDKITDSVPDPEPDKKSKTTQTVKASASLNAPQYPHKKQAAECSVDQNEVKVPSTSKKSLSQKKSKRRKKQDLEPEPAISSAKQKQLLIEQESVISSGYEKYLDGYKKQSDNKKRPRLKPNSAKAETKRTVNKDNWENPGITANETGKNALETTKSTTTSRTSRKKKTTEQSNDDLKNQKLHKKRHLIICIPKSIEIEHKLRTSKMLTENLDSYRILRNGKKIKIDVENVLPSTSSGDNDLNVAGNTTTSCNFNASATNEKAMISDSRPSTPISKEILEEKAGARAKNGFTFTQMQNVFISDSFMSNQGCDLSIIKIPPRKWKYYVRNERFEILGLVLQGSGRLISPDIPIGLNVASRFCVPMNEPYSIINDGIDEMILSCYMVNSCSL